MSFDAFDFDLVEQMGARKAFNRKPKVEADPSEPSPFGAAKPEVLPSVQRAVGKSAARVGGTKKRRNKTRDHYPRVVALLEKEHGGFFWVCDGMKVGYGGAMVATDLLGFMDLQGIHQGRLTGVNVTSVAKAASHLRDYTDPSKTHGQAKKPVEGLLRRFLDNGGAFLMVGYVKVGARWQYEITEVTAELLDEYKARKRGAK